MAPKIKTGGPIAAPRLKAFVERIERLEEERHAIGGDIRDIYSEAKGVGFDVKAIRWLIAERKIDVSDRDERDAIRDTYAHALGMAVSLVQVEGLSLRAAAKQAGVSKSSLHRALAVPEVSQHEAPDAGQGPPSNGGTPNSTGPVTTPTPEGAGDGGLDLYQRITGAFRPARREEARQGDEGCGPGVPGECPADSNGTYPERSNRHPQPDLDSTSEAVPESAMGPVAPSSARVGEHNSWPDQDDGLDIPAFLRRQAS